MSFLVRVTMVDKKKGELRKLLDSLNELHRSVCERRLARTALRPALLPFKSAQFTRFFPLRMTSHGKIAV